MKILRSIPGVALLLWNTFVSPESALAVSGEKGVFMPKVPGSELLLSEDELFPGSSHRDVLYEESIFRRLPAIKKIDWDELIRQSEAEMAVKTSV